VHGASREGGRHPVEGVQRVRVADPLDADAVRAAVEGSDAVVHLAARVHVMHERAAYPLAEFRRANVAATTVLAEQAAAAGVRSVVLASTVKAVGERNTSPWTEETPPEPMDPYGVSKLEAEQALAGIARRRKLGGAILRFPLVYGPGMKGNMLRLFSLVDRGMPLPFGAVANRRSMLYMGNLVAAVLAVLERESAEVETFFASDGRDLSLTKLLRMIGEALGKPARLLPVPAGMLRMAMPRATADRLIGSLTVDASKLARVVGYRPPYSVEDGIRDTASWYRRHVTLSEAKGA
jgi:nucleoside-diphosphate-sugar epimerase